MIINPQDRVGRSNLAEHDQMIAQGNANDALVREAKIESSNALAIATTASSRVDTAWQSANAALDKATTADTKATINTTNITALNDDISTLNGLMDFITANAFISVSFEKTATAVTAVFRRKDGTQYSANLPIATTTTAGFLDSAMKQQIDANSNAIVVLQSQYPTIFVEFPSASPTQQEIQTVYENYRTAYPSINLPAVPAQGFTMVDASNNIRVEYDKVTTTWVFSPTGISKSTNATYGVIVGEENGADGSLYIVAGKALVNGFDALKGRMSDAESAIAIRVTTDTFNAHTASTTLHKSSSDITKLGALPLIANGDAGKVLTVKSDETGYENRVMGHSPTFHDYAETIPAVVALMHSCGVGDQIMGVISGIDANLNMTEHICFSVTKLNTQEFVGAIAGKWASGFGVAYKMWVDDKTWLDNEGIAVQDESNNIHKFQPDGQYTLIRVYAITGIYE